MKTVQLNDFKKLLYSLIFVFYIDKISLFILIKNKNYLNH